MTLNELHQLVAKGESDTLEFKKSTSLLPEAFETACAFLNTEGGIVLVGVTNDGRINGQDVSDTTRQKIASHIAKLEPSAQSQLEIKYLKIEKNKYVIAILVKKGEHVPYSYSARSFMRVETTTVPMPQHRFEQLIVERGQLNHVWENFIADGYTIDSLDQEELRRTVRDGVNENRIAVEALNYSVEQILRQFDLLKNGKLINAAIALYAKETRFDYPQCSIKMARFRGLDKSAAFMDSQQIYGNAFKILSEANYFIMRHLPVASFFESDKFKRIDKPALPVLSIREALINAICHRNYSNKSASISLAIFDDRMVIWNNGSLPKELKLQDLSKPHESFPKNHKIAQVFYNRGWIEKWGTGTLRMADYCKELGAPKPKFEIYSGGVAVVLRFVEPMKTLMEKSAGEVKLTARQQAILNIIKKLGAATVKLIISKLDTVVSKRTLQNDLSYLQKHGLIELKGHTNAAEWVFIGSDSRKLTQTRANSRKLAKK